MPISKILDPGRAKREAVNLVSDLSREFPEVTYSVHWGNASTLFVYIYSPVDMEEGIFYNGELNFIYNRLSAIKGVDDIYDEEVDSKTYLYKVYFKPRMLSSHEKLELFSELKSYLRRFNSLCAKRRYPEKFFLQSPREIRLGFSSPIKHSLLNDPIVQQVTIAFELLGAEAISFNQKDGFAFLYIWKFDFDVSGLFK